MDHIWTVIGYSTLTLVAAWVGAYLGSRFQKSGEIDAISSRLNEVVKHTAALAETTATINTQVARLDWGQREVTTLRQIKLEELLDKAREARQTVEGSIFDAYRNRDLKDNDLAINRVKTIGALFLRELYVDVSVFARDYHTLKARVITLKVAASARDREAVRLDQLASAQREFNPAQLSADQIDILHGSANLHVQTNQAFQAALKVLEQLSEKLVIVEGKAAGLMNQILGQVVGQDTGGVDADYAPLFEAMKQNETAIQIPAASPPTA